MKPRFAKLRRIDHFSPVTEWGNPEFFRNLQYALLHALREMDCINEYAFLQSVDKLL